MESRAERMERRLRVPLIAGALLTVPALVLEQSVEAEPWSTIGAVLNWTIWGLFLAEVVLMLMVSDRPWTWIRQHPLELTIVILSPPFLPAGLQAARVFRLLRILRLVKGAMLARRILSTQGVRDAAALTLLTLVGGGLAFSAVEKGQHLSAWDGIWWAAETITTVGYGDTYPHTTAGRVIAIAVMFIGIGFVAIVTAAAASRFVQTRREDSADVAQILAKLDVMSAELEALKRGVTP